MRRLLRAISYSLVLFFLLLSWVSGALCCVLGCGYFSAQLDNRTDVSDYTQTAIFRRTLRETFDTLYETAVSGQAPTNLPDGTAYFVYSLHTNRSFCSEPNIADIPSFEASFSDNESIVCFCRYTSGTYRGTSFVTGEAVSFEYSSFNAATELFDGTAHSYEDVAILVAVRQPTHMTMDGFGASLLEWYLLQNGLPALFVLIGIFLLSLSVVLANGSRRRRIERRISDLVSWLYLEVRLALLLAVSVICVRCWSFPPSFPTTVSLTFLLLPALYVLRCSVRYRGNTPFFTHSAIAQLIRFIRAQLDLVLPITRVQRDLRLQAVRLLLFGLCLPMLLFFLVDLLIGVSVVRLLLPFYLLYFAVLLGLFYRRYASLANGISELERLSAVLPLGEQVPDHSLSESDPLYPLATHLNQVDQAVQARAEWMLSRSLKKFTRISDSISAMKEQLRLLESAMPDASATEAGICLRRLSQLADEMQDTVLHDMPVTAPVMKRMDLLAALDEVAHARMPEIIAAQITFEKQLPPAPVLITADPRHIHAVLDILYGNLAMYALAGSTADLRIFREADCWRFVLVNRFASSGDADSSAAKCSTGLTLAREYLALNGGSLESSINGNCFGVSFTLPAAR